MFSKTINSDNKEFMIYITLECKGKKRFRVWAEESGKQNSKYVDRIVEVNGKFTIDLKFPQSPKSLFIGIANAVSPYDKDFEVTGFIEAPLKTYNVWLDDKTQKFVKFAQQFSAVCGYEQASDRGRRFRSPNQEFNIFYFDMIRDPNSGAVMNTPASIGHNSGRIFAAKTKFDKYTVPMRMVILLHEYCHKYRNPKIGLRIDDEIGADINALYIYLGLGYSKIDAITVFSKVFLKAQTDENMARIRKINDYITRFESGEYAQAV